MNNLDQNSRSSDREWKPGLPVYEAGVLIPNHDVHWEGLGDCIKSRHEDKSTGSVASVCFDVVASISASYCRGPLFE
jgi:hypothetical protein